MTAKARERKPRRIERLRLAPEIQIGNGTAGTRRAMPGHEEQHRDERQPPERIGIEQGHRLSVHVQKAGLPAGGNQRLEWRGGDEARVRQAVDAAELLELRRRLGKLIAIRGDGAGVDHERIAARFFEVDKL